MEIAGTYRGIPVEDEENLEVWVLVEPEDHKYYPQSSDADNESPAEFGGGVWSVMGNLGEGSEVFDIVVVLTDKGSEASTRFKQYLREGYDSGTYEGIPDCTMPTALTEKARITVRTGIAPPTPTPTPPGPTPSWCRSFRPPLADSDHPGEFQIVKPENCADNLAYTLQIAGTYTGISPEDEENLEVWVLVYPQDHKYYPQSADDRSECPADFGGGVWIVPGHLGGEGVPEVFDIVVVVTNEGSEASTRFKQYLREGYDSGGNYEGIPPSEMPTNLTEKASVRVRTDGETSAYIYLYDVMDRYQTGNALRLLESYDDTGTFNDGDTAWTYDNALVMLALMVRGTATDWERTKVLAGSLVYAQNNDRDFADGRVRDAYSAASLIGGAGKAQIVSPGSAIGNMAWTMLAWLGYWGAKGGTSYLDAATQLGQWIYDNTYDTRGDGGYTGGYSSSLEKYQWKATEHNIDVYVAFMKLYEATGDPVWFGRARHARDFVQAMWNETEGYFWTGTTDDGTTINSSPIPEDVQSWGLMALGETDTYGVGITWAESNLSINPCSSCTSYHGFKFSDVGNGCWFEGTAHMAIAFQIKGETAKADDIEGVLRNVQTSAPNNNGTGIVSACPDGAETGFGWSYPNALHIGATAWYLFAEREHNPFWQIGTSEAIPTIPGEF